MKKVQGTPFGQRSERLTFIELSFYFQILLDSSKHLTKSNDYSYMIPWLGTGQ